MKKYALLLITLLSFGCDTIHEYNQTVDNMTSQTITLSFSEESLFQYPDSIIILPNTQTVLYDYSSIGGEPNGFGCQLTSGEIDVRVSGGFQLTKDITDENNWVQNLNGKKSVTEMCIFEIEESDLQ